MMTEIGTIVFVCEHGAAKSVIAAAYFNSLAREKGLDLMAVARGTQPDEELSPKTVIGLQKDGLTPAETKPRKLAPEEAGSARRIISFCDLPEEYHQAAVIERWEDVPPVSENYQAARDAIVKNLHCLLAELTQT
ncbi:MAG: hypothetical protein HND47_03315 [Chloroflexi bacterium]|nr:hypothetical protein [Chloroflexota bacterium]